MRATWVVDTSALLEDPGLLEKSTNTVYVPYVVVLELEKKKTAPGELGSKARKTIRILETLRCSGDLSKGVKNKQGSKIIVVDWEYDDAKQNDDVIIFTALDIKSPKTKPVTLLTNDIAMRIKASAMSIKSMAWKAGDGEDELYTGKKNIVVDGQCVDDLYTHGFFVLEGDDFNDNQFLVVESNTTCSAALARVRKEADGFTANALMAKRDDDRALISITPRNSEQKFAEEVLMDPDVELVTLNGMAGCGKTLLALSAGWDQVVEKQRYEKIIIVRPIVSVGKELGHLPGDISEKMAPWIEPIKDNLAFLLGGNKQAVESYMQSGQIEIQPLSHIRGRSIPNAWIIVDEAQNLSPEEAKTILTRVAEGSKVVMVGDIGQIDTKGSSKFNNGITHVVNRLKNQEIFAHITLTKGQRSKLATLTAEFL